MQSPSSRSCSSGPNLRAAIRRAASGGQPPEALPECYRDAASQSLCHYSRWSQTLLVSHHHHDADFKSSSPNLFFLPICQSQEQSLNFSNQSLILRH
jgi:hypothetical protein